MPASALPDRPVFTASAMIEPRVWSSRDSTSRERWRRRIFTVPALLIGFFAFDLEDDEAIVIFPEGTRYSDAKREQAIDILERTAPERVVSARRLQHVLPIRTAGLLAILGAAPSTDLLFLNHVGVQDFRTLDDLWRNVPFPVPLQFHATRSSRDEAPGASELVDWLDARWEELDDWVASNTVN